MRRLYNAIEVRQNTSPALNGAIFLDAYVYYHLGTSLACSKKKEINIVMDFCELGS